MTLYSTTGVSSGESFFGRKTKEKIHELGQGMNIKEEIQNQMKFEKDHSKTVCGFEKTCKT